MFPPNRIALLSDGQEGDNTSLAHTLSKHSQFVAEHRAAVVVRDSAEEATTKSLAPELQRAVQALCDTYEALDLRIETTLGAAEADFLAALPEISGCEAEMRHLVAILIADVRVAAGNLPDTPLLLRFAYQNKGELVEQILSGAKARLVILPTEENVSHHVNVQGDR